MTSIRRYNSFGSEKVKSHNAKIHNKTDLVSMYAEDPSSFPQLPRTFSFLKPGFKIEDTSSTSQQPDRIGSVSPDLDLVGAANSASLCSLHRPW